MNTDTVGSHKIFAMLGATNHSDNEREKNDYYATDPKAMELLLELETFSKDVWECACGAGHLSKVLTEHGYRVWSTDIVDRGYGESGIDFLHTNIQYDGDIITNPPYAYAQEFVEHAMDCIADGHKVAMFLRLNFLEGKKRRKLFDMTPPKTIYVASGRLSCAMGGDFDKFGKGAQAHAWYVWEKGYNGPTIIKWFN